jgi:hypothetical protein
MTDSPSPLDLVGNIPGVLYHDQTDRRIERGYLAIRARADTTHVAVLEQQGRGTVGFRDEVVQRFNGSNFNKGSVHGLFRLRTHHS